MSPASRRARSYRTTICRLPEGAPRSPFRTANSYCPGRFSVAGPSTLPTLSTIKVPTLVIAGADDKLITPDNSKEIADGIPGARLEMVEHCGHMGMIERPETYTRLLGEFVA